MGEWLVKWFDTYKVPKLKDSSLRNMRENIYRDILPCSISELPLLKVSGEDIQNFLIACSFSNTRVKLGMILNAALKKATALRKIAFNPYASVELPTHYSEPYRAFEYDEQVAVLNTEYNPMYLSVFWLLCCCGFRVGELAALDFNKDVNLDAMTISVSKSIDAVAKKVVLPKTKKSVRFVPFTVDLIPHIEVLQNYQRTGKHVTYNGMHMHFGRLYKRLGLTEVTLHSMRHTFVSLCYAVGMREKQIQLFAGHSKFDITLNVYTHLLKKGTSPLLDYMKKLKEQTDLI